MTQTSVSTPSSTTQAQTPAPAGPARCRQWRVHGNAGSDILVSRTHDAIDIQCVTGGWMGNGANCTDALIEALRAAQAEVRALLTYLHGKPAVVGCRTCRTSVYVESYEHGKNYYCRSTEQRLCFDDDQPRERRRRK